jgi:hypothetical protein
MRRRRKKAQPVREMSDTAQWAVVGMGAAILTGVFYLLLRNDPPIPQPTGSQVPDKLRAPTPLPEALLAVQATYSTVASNGSTFALKVGDTIAFRPPTAGAQWGRMTQMPQAGLVLAAKISDFGVQSDGSYMLRMDSSGQAVVSLYSTTTGAMAINLTVTP